MNPRRSWKEKPADSKDLPRVQEIPERMRAKWGYGTLVIPAPKEVDETMRRVPKGKVTTVNHIRQALAKRHYVISNLERSLFDPSGSTNELAR